MVFWRSAEAADVEHAEFFCRKLALFLWHIATMSEDQVKCICNSRVCCELFPIGLQVAMTACTNPESLTNWNTELEISCGSWW